MSAITATSRIAARAAGRTTTRNFSLLRAMRDSARSFEPHPFQRLPAASVETAKPDYARLARMVGRTGSAYVLGATILIWAPVSWRWVVDTANGV